LKVEKAQKLAEQITKAQTLKEIKKSSKAHQKLSNTYS
jgi:hypothetical protein